MSVNKIVCERFNLLYGLPKTQNLPGFYAEYIKALDSTDKTLLAAGVDLLVKRHPMSAGAGIWPSPGAIAEAVNEAAANLDQRQRYTNPALPAPRHREPTKAERARVNDLMASFRRNMQEAAIAIGGFPINPAILCRPLRHARKSRTLRELLSGLTAYRCAPVGIGPPPRACRLAVHNSKL